MARVPALVAQQGGRLPAVADHDVRVAVVVVVGKGAPHAMARVVDAGVARRLHEAAALVAKQRVDRIRRTFVPWERGAVDEVNVQVLSPSKSTKATPERFDYALAPGEVLARDLTEGAPREGEPGTPGKLTVQVHSPDSRLQPSRMDIPGPPGDESEE